MSDGFTPGHAPVPPREPNPEYPPTSPFPAVGYPTSGDYPPPGYGAPPPPPPGYGAPPPGYGAPPPGYGAPPSPPPRKSNTPLIALILTISVLLCGGAVTAVVLAVRNVTDKAQEAVESLPEPTLPAVPTDLPTLPAGKKITVTYEVTGDGPAEIFYTEKLGQSPQRVRDAKLPWRLTTTMEGAAVISVTTMRRSIESGAIACRATVDGETVAENTKQGGLATTVSCNKFVLN